MEYELEQGIKKGSWPNLTTADVYITSPSHGYYNCFAWAACDTHRPWTPDTYQHYWPFPTKDLTVPMYVKAFELLGYSECPDGSLETGIQKIAIYADADEYVTHMARQLENGEWTSKLGKWEDVRHRTVEALESDPNPDFVETHKSYGTVQKYIARQRKASDPNPIKEIDPPISLSSLIGR